MKAILALAFLGVMASCGHATKFDVLIEGTMGENGKVILTLKNKFNGVSSSKMWTRYGEKIMTSVSFDELDACVDDIDRVEMEYEKSDDYHLSVTVTDENGNSREFASRFTSLQEIKEDPQITQSVGEKVKYILRLTEGEVIRKFVVYVKGLRYQEATTYVTPIDKVFRRTNDVYLPKAQPKENEPWVIEKLVNDSYDVDTIDEVTITRLVEKSLDNGNPEDKKCSAQVCIYDENSGKCRVYSGSPDWDIDDDDDDEVEYTASLRTTGQTLRGTLEECLANFDFE